MLTPHLPSLPPASPQPECLLFYTGFTKNKLWWGERWLRYLEEMVTGDSRNPCIRSLHWIQPLVSLVLACPMSTTSPHNSHRLSKLQIACMNKVNRVGTHDRLSVACTYIQTQMSRHNPPSFYMCRAYAVLNASTELIFPKSRRTLERELTPKETLYYL